jgi:hypothetical protein
VQAYGNARSGDCTSTGITSAYNPITFEDATLFGAGCAFMKNTSNTAQAVKMKKPKYISFLLDCRMSNDRYFLPLPLASLIAGILGMRPADLRNGLILVPFIVGGADLVD